MSSVDYVSDWLWGIDDQETVPPFCVEVVLRDGTHYWLHSVVAKDDLSKSLALRVWDLRAFGESEIEDLKSRLNEMQRRGELRGEIHPKLDYGNLRVHLMDIWYCMEWHDRLWPEGIGRKLALFR
jgi:hypothetical protein